MFQTFFRAQARVPKKKSRLRPLHFLPKFTQNLVDAWNISLLKRTYFYFDSCVCLKMCTFYVHIKTYIFQVASCNESIEIDGICAAYRLENIGFDHCTKKAISCQRKEEITRHYALISYWQPLTHTQSIWVVFFSFVVCFTF